MHYTNVLPQTKSISLRNRILRVKTKKILLLLILLLAVIIFAEYPLLKEFYLNLTLGRDVSVLWSHKLKGEVRENFALTNINNRLIAVIPSGGFLYAIDTKSGDVLWNFTTERQAISTSPAITKTSDGVVYIAIGDYDGNIYLLNGANGSLIWKKDLSGEEYDDRGINQIIALDLNSDNSLEIIVSGPFNLHVLNGKNGSVIWEKLGCATLFLVEDINQDGILDIISYGFSVKTSAFNGIDGSLIWRSNISILWSAGILDIDGDNRSEIVSDFGEIIDTATGVLKDNKSISFSSYPSFGDLDNDGHIDLAAGAMGSYVKAFDLLTRELLWKFKGETPPFSLYPKCPAPSVGDIDGDNRLDVIAAIRTEGAVYAFSGENGKILWRFKTDSNEIWASPQLADIDGDGQVEVLVISSKGTVYALKYIKRSGFRIYWEGGNANLNTIQVMNLKFVDPDYDGLSTYTENIIGTNPYNPDTDGDGYNDGLELINGTNPLNKNSTP